MFKKNKIPLELKILGIATYIQTLQLGELLEFFLKLIQFLKLQYRTG